MLAVTGATGTIGGCVATQLAEAGHRFRALVRDPSKLNGSLGPEGEVAVADLSRPETLDGALHGVQRLFLLTPNVSDGERLALAANAIDAARRAAVDKVVYLSVTASGKEPEQAYGRVHHETERKLEASGLTWTHLRPIAFMSNLRYSVESIKAERAFHLPTGDGKVSAIAPEDVAAVAVKALVEDGHESEIYDLTGPEALSHAEQAKQLSAAIGSGVDYVDVSEAAAREALLEAGMPSEAAENLLEFYALIKAGERALIAPDFQRLMNREPRTFAAYFEQNVGAFR